MVSSALKIGIIGAGLIGCERIEALKHLNQKIIGVFDTNITLLNKVCQKYNVPLVSSVKSLLSEKPDWVVVAVPHNVAPEIIKQCMSSGCNVLAEKPLGRSLEECMDVVNYKPDNIKLNVGFNYRYYDGINRLLKDYKNNKFGQLISVNMILAHGNSPDMKGSWKLDPIKDGGVLIDLGVHLLDLSHQICPNLKLEKTKLWNGFWNTGINDEEAHLLLSGDNSIFNLQVSLNRWKSHFRMEINGTEGYGVVEGRGRSYGPQTYRTGDRWGWHTQNKSQSETEAVHDCNVKNSFIEETACVLGLKKDIITPCDHIEIVKVMKIADEAKF